MEQTLKDNGGWNSTPWRIAGWAGAAVLMMIPASVQLVSGNFGWNLLDFIIVGVVLLLGASLFDFAARKAPSFAYLAGAAAALAAGFGLFMVNGAVGLVGSEDEAANLLFGAVILVAVAGAVVARGTPEGLSRAMLAAALTHGVVSVVAMLLVTDRAGATLSAEIVGLSMFGALWLASAGLFRRSAR